MHCMTQERYNRRCRRRAIQIGLMMTFLVSLITISMIGIVTNSGPIILGTELNTNGVVEYLCLGNGCDDLTDMDW